MRYLPIEYVQEGMTLALPLYGGNFEALLGAGVTLSSYHIQRLSAVGYAGVYIQDEISADIDVPSLLPDEIHLNTVRAAKEAWEQALSGGQPKTNARTARARQDRIVMPVINGVIANRQRMIERIDLKPEEDYIYYHAASTMILSILIGVELGLSGVQLYELGLSALLHDVGNIFIPKNLLDKPGKLTADEYEVVRSHTQLGFNYLRENFDISIEGCMGALQHHENFDGSGYPTGLKRNKISIYGRIIAIADVYDALTSKRPYRNLLYPPAAMEYMNMNAGTLFDPKVLEALQRVVPLYPSGFGVELSPTTRGIVVKNFVGQPTRPRISVLSGKGKRVATIDLHDDPQFKDYQVVGIVDL